MIWSFFGGINGFFQSTTWTIVQVLVAVFVILFWAATVYWVRKDAKRRIQSRTLIQLVTLLGAIPPFLGPLIYMLFRPPEFLEDVRERQLEIQAIERRFGAEECPVCRAEVEPDFLICPVCSKRLRQSCVTCLRPLDAAWFVCPYCETPVGGREVTPEPWPTATGKPARAAPRASRTAPRKAN